jgi:hypothetical protein
MVECFIKSIVPHTPNVGWATLLRTIEKKVQKKSSIYCTSGMVTHLNAKVNQKRPLMPAQGPFDERPPTQGIRFSLNL